MGGPGRENDREIMALWEALEPKIRETVREMTRDCIRCRRATVVTAPDSATGKIGVQFPFDNKVLQLPYSSAAASLTAGSQAWVILPYDETLSNAVVVQNGSWTL